MKLRCIGVAIVALAAPAWCQEFPASHAAGSGSTLYAVSGTSLLRTLDGGVNWSAVYIDTPGQAQPVKLVATEVGNPSTVYAFTDLDRGGVSKSIDRGVTWTKANTGLPAAGAIDRVFSVSNQPQTLYAQVGATIYKTSNGGASWSVQSRLPTASTIFTINAATPSLMYYANQGNAASPTITVFRSTDEGVTWSLAGTFQADSFGLPPGSTVNSVSVLASAPADPNIVYAVRRGPGANFASILKSTDQGANWNVILGGQRQRAWVDGRSNLFITGPEFAAGNPFSYQKSTNGGVSFVTRQIATGVGGQPDLLFDQSAAAEMLAASSRGVHRSTDFGESWRLLSGTVKGTLVSAIPALDLVSSPGPQLTQDLALRFLENAQWTGTYSVQAEGGSWLSTATTTGAIPGTLQVRVSTTGLTDGTYTGSLRISSTAASNSPLVVPVTLTISSASLTPTYRVSTLAGGGPQANTQDGLPATEASVMEARGVAVHPDGLVWFTDVLSHRVRRVTAQGTVETLAGIGRSGDGPSGPATQSALSQPHQVAFGIANDYYIADLLNNKIKRVDAQGNLTTFTTGTGLNAPSLPGGVAVDSAGNVYVRLQGGTARVTPAGVATVLDSSDRFASKMQMCLDKDRNLFVAETERHRIVKLSPTGTRTVVAGTGTTGFSGDGAPATLAQLNAPEGVALDESGNVYIADTGNFRIRMVDGRGIISTIAGSSKGSSGNGGLASEVMFNSPRNIAVARNGDLFVADSGVRKLTLLRPAISAGGVANAASYAAEFSPGSLVAIFGELLATGTDAAKSAPWSTRLAGATVLLNGRAMPLYYVAPGQINAMIPYETAPGPATLTVMVNGVRSAEYTLSISAASPGIIVFGENRAVAVNEDGSLNTAANPAKRGSTVVIYLIGIGPTDFPVASGAAAPLDRLVRPAGATSVMLGNRPVTPGFLGLTPGSVALAQMNLKLDDDLAEGAYAVKVVIAGRESNAPLISVKN